MVRKLLKTVLVLGALLALAPSAAWAQSAIAGQVRDTSGAVLPGVTVEATSPALIEGTRTVFTDERGQYNIVDLRPGTYTVVFTLTGFRNVRREGVEVPSNVTVPISAELEVGSVEESITVTGASPVVDTRSAQRTAVLSKDVLDALPTSRSVSSLGAVVPGVRLSKPDLGGTQAMQQIYGSAHGMDSNQNNVTVDGMDVRPNTDTAQYQQYFNAGMTQEMTYQLAAQPADVLGGGMRINVIPRDGGNQVAGEFFIQGANTSMQANNLTKELEDKGLKSPSSIASMWDINPVIGGPLKRDRLWIIGSGRANSVNTIPAGSFYKIYNPAVDKLNPYVAPGVPDPSRPGIEDQYVNYLTARLTAQLTSKDKLTLYYDRAYKNKNHDMTDAIAAGGGTAGGIDVETGAQRRQPKLYLFSQAKYTSTLTSRLLLEAGLSLPTYARNGTCQEGTLFERGTPEWYANAMHFDFIRGTQWKSCASDNHSIENAQVPNAALSYVTGSHNLKGGFSWKYGPRRQTTTRNADLMQRYRDGVPDSVQVYTSPDEVAAYLNADLGLYLMDSWTIDRVTISPGIRWNHVDSSHEAKTKLGGRFSQTTITPRIEDQPNWSDWTPRLAGSVDLFGNGKTAVKANVGKYMRYITTSLAQRYSPFAVSTEIRNWNDCAIIPGSNVTCDPAKIGAPGYRDDIAQDNEIGPSTNSSFGVKTNRTPADDLRRVYSWQSSASVQQQIIPGLSVLVAYYRLTTTNPEVLINTAVDPVADYKSFTIANPLAGTNEQITVFNQTGNKGKSVLVDRNSDINQDIYTGYEVSFNGRLPHGVTLFGGWTAEHTVSITCDTSDPNKWRFCDQTGETFQQYGKNVSVPLVHEVKLNGSYDAPYGVQIGAAYISYAGSLSPINYVVPTAAFAPVGGRTASVTLPLQSPGIDYLPRWGEFDLSFKKDFRLGGSKSLTAMVDIFNVPNSSTILTVQQNFGNTLGNPTSTIQGRLIKLGGRFRF